MTYSDHVQQMPVRLVNRGCLKKKKLFLVWSFAGGNDDDVTAARCPMERETDHAGLETTTPVR